MSKKIPLIKLSETEQEYLRNYVNTGKRSARSIKRAQVLLQSHSGQAVEQIAEWTGVCKGTVYNIRDRYQEGGLEGALKEKPRSGQPRKLNLEQEARLTVLACSDAPGGYERWTVRLLADKVVELGIVESIGRETVRQFLKKTNSGPGARSAGASGSPRASI